MSLLVETTRFAVAVPGEHVDGLLHLIFINFSLILSLISYNPHSLLVGSADSVQFMQFHDYIQ